MIIPSDTPRTDAARGFHDMETAVDADRMEGMERELNDERESFRLYREKSRDEAHELHKEVLGLRTQLAEKQGTINRLLDESSNIATAMENVQLRARLAAERARTKELVGGDQIDFARTTLPSLAGAGMGVSERAGGRKEGRAMNEETQRVIIARECGWKDVELRLYNEGTGMDCWIWTSGVLGRGGREIPDYPRDLNACAEFEGVLKDSHTSQDFEKARYIGHLENLVARRAAECGWSFALVMATPREKCEAFLKAKFLWREDRSEGK